MKFESSQVERYFSRSVQGAPSKPTMNSIHPLEAFGSLSEINKSIGNILELVSL